MELALAICPITELYHLYLNPLYCQTPLVALGGVSQYTSN